MGMETNLAAIMVACTECRLDGFQLHIKPRHSVTAVSAARGYPDSHKKGDIISMDLEEEQAQKVSFCKEEQARARNKHRNKKTTRSWPETLSPRGICWRSQARLLLAMRLGFI